MIDYNGQVLPLCPRPAVHFSSLILFEIEKLMFVERNDRALASVERRTSRKGAILVPNSRLARGNGLYTTGTANRQLCYGHCLCDAAPESS